MKNLKDIPQLRRYLNYHNIQNGIVPDGWFNKIKYHGFNWASPKSIDVVALIKLLRSPSCRKVANKLLNLKDIPLLNVWLSAEGYESENREKEGNYYIVMNVLSNNKKLLPLTSQQSLHCYSNYSWDNEKFQYMIEAKLRNYIEYWDNYGVPSEEGFESFSTIEKMKWWEENYPIFYRSGRDRVRFFLNFVSDDYLLPMPKKSIKDDIENQRREEHLELKILIKEKMSFQSINFLESLVEKKSKFRDDPGGDLEVKIFEVDIEIANIFQDKYSESPLFQVEIRNMIFLVELKSPVVMLGEDPWTCRLSWRERPSDKIMFSDEFHSWKTFGKFVNGLNLPMEGLLSKREIKFVEDFVQEKSKTKRRFLSNTLENS